MARNKPKLTIEEKAHKIKHLCVDVGMTYTRIAKEIGSSQAELSRLLSTDRTNRILDDALQYLTAR